MDEKKEAQNILNIYRLMKQDGKLYLEENDEVIDGLFEAVTMEITYSTILKTKLPYKEFVLPSRKVLENDSGWVGHFKNRDNRRFFLSDIYDYLYLFYEKR